MFHLGQRVIHVGFEFRDVDDSDPDHPLNCELPVVGEVYTVTNVYTIENDELIELFEIYSPENEHWCAGFYASGFRPVNRTDTYTKENTYVWKTRRKMSRATCCEEQGEEM